MVDYLIRLSMGTVAHEKELVREVHRLARFRVCLVKSTEDKIFVQNSLESSLIDEVKKSR